MAISLILAVGQDPTVLSTRCAVLRSAGYVVRPASGAAEAIDLFRNIDFDLVLLCHSVAISERDQIVRTVRSSGSRVPIYTVSSASGDFRADHADGVFSSVPQDLVKEVNAVFGSTSRGPFPMQRH